MRRHIAVVLVISALVLPGSAWAQTLTKTAPITYIGTITAISTTTRVITTHNNEGVLDTWEVPASVPQSQLDGLKVGDLITVRYIDSISIRRKPPEEPAVDRTDPTTGIRTATVTVGSVDLAERSITVTGASGRTYTRHIPNQADVGVLQQVKAGERVDVSFFEQMTISMGSTELRHRFTISGLWGLDNQFSGKMIKAADGQTVGGSPINLAETTYDDVYGSMQMFKVGFGYRTSPRTEAVVNVVYSFGKADPVQIGTVGTIRLPVNVQFTDFSYWGIEGGQRFYFARTRFTPFVGYLVGANRYGDIRGDFVDVPPGSLNLLPGYQAQDHKFFEKSWAFSVGPTAGLLIGLGPIELMAEAQFRFMGGLSDVDWLVEEGLKDINTESSRWSYPILVGVRIRF